MASPCLHEFRKPLNAVIELSQLQLPLPRKALNFVEHIMQAGDQLLGLTNDVLDPSRIEAGEMMLQHSAFELVPLLDAVRAIIVPQGYAKGLALVFDLVQRYPRACIATCCA